MIVPFHFIGYFAQRNFGCELALDPSGRFMTVTGRSGQSERVDAVAWEGEGLGRFDADRAVEALARCAGAVSVPVKLPTGYQGESSYEADFASAMALLGIRPYTRKGRSDILEKLLSQDLFIGTARLCRVSYVLQFLGRGKVIWVDRRLGLWRRRFIYPAPTPLSAADDEALGEMAC